MKRVLLVIIGCLIFCTSCIGAFSKEIDGGFPDKIILSKEGGEFSYVQALKAVGKDIKDYQKASNGARHKFLDLRFENERLVILVECKSKFSRWDKTKIQGQLQDYVRFEKAYSNKKIVAILAETDGDNVWVWYGQSVIIDDEHKVEEESSLRPFEEYEDLCFGKVNDKIKEINGSKIALSLKFDDANPWKDAAAKYAVGTEVTGTVARMTDFGAFVELEPGVDALLHVSQISKEHVEKPADVLKVGDEVTAKVVDFNEADKKISLSVKAMFAPEPAAEAAVEEDADVVAVDIDAVIASEDAE